MVQAERDKGRRSERGGKKTDEAEEKGGGPVGKYGFLSMREILTEPFYDARKEWREKGAKLI